MPSPTSLQAHIHRANGRVQPSSRGPSWRGTAPASKGNIGTSVSSGGSCRRDHFQFFRPTRRRKRRSGAEKGAADGHTTAPHPWKPLAVRPVAYPISSVESRKTASQNCPKPFVPTGWSHLGERLRNDGNTGSSSPKAKGRSSPPPAPTTQASGNGAAERIQGPSQSPCHLVSRIAAADRGALEAQELLDFLTGIDPPPKAPPTEPEEWLKQLDSTQSRVDSGPPRPAAKRERGEESVAKSLNWSSQHRQSRTTREVIRRRRRKEREAQEEFHLWWESREAHEREWRKEVDSDPYYLDRLGPLDVADLPDPALQQTPAPAPSPLPAPAPMADPPDEDQGPQGKGNAANPGTKFAQLNQLPCGKHD